jgi:hypothetical protein
VLDHHLGIGQIVLPQATPVVEGPASDFLGDQFPQRSRRMSLARSSTARSIIWNGVDLSVPGGITR